MAWFDAILGPLDFIDAAWHTMRRMQPTRARSRKARGQSGAVLIRVPHPSGLIRKERGSDVPLCIEVNDHLRRHGVRTWFGRFDSEWLHIVARESQRRQVTWLLSGDLDVISYSQMREYQSRWGEGPRPR